MISESSSALAVYVRGNVKVIVWSLLVFGAVVLAAPSRAVAEDAREVEGRAAFSKGDYARALDIFARLYAENGDPVYLRNIGRCHQKLRQPDEAIDAFRNYLRRGRKLKPAEKKEVEGFIAEMQALKATMKEEAAAAERAAEKDRARAEAKSTEAKARTSESEAKSRSGAAPPPAEPPKETSESQPPIAQIPRAKVPADDGSGAPGEPARAGSWHPAAAWVGLGLTLVAGGVGAYGAIHNHTLVSDFDQTCAIDPMTKDSYSRDTTRRSDASCVSLHGDYKAATTLAIVSFAGAAVLAGATLVVWLTAPSSNESQVSMWSCAPSVTAGRGAAMGCSLRF